MRALSRLLVVLSLVALGSLPALAQGTTSQPAAPPPAPAWTGSFGAGLSLTRGNSDTTNVNLSFDTKYDPKTKSLFKAEALYLRGRTDGNDTANRLFLQGRLERLVTARVFVFGQLQHLRDPFKGIDYLIAPTGGVGYKLVDTAATQFSVDTSLGVVWEKNPDIDVRTSVAWLAGEKISHKLSATSTFTESAQALWKPDDMGDALYTFTVGLAAGVTQRTQLKVEALDNYKTRPPSGTDKNDVALLLSLVFKY